MRLVFQLALKHHKFQFLAERILARDVGLIKVAFQPGVICKVRPLVPSRTDGTQLVAVAHVDNKLVLRVESGIADPAEGMALFGGILVKGELVQIGVKRLLEGKYGSVQEAERTEQLTMPLLQMPHELLLRPTSSLAENASGFQPGKDLPLD
jgi:hypothetical protein